MWVFLFYHHSFARALLNKSGCALFMTMEYSVDCSFPAANDFSYIDHTDILVSHCGNWSLRYMYKEDFTHICPTLNPPPIFFYFVLYYLFVPATLNVLWEKKSSHIIYVRSELTTMLLKTFTHITHTFQECFGDIVFHYFFFGAFQYICLIPEFLSDGP